MEGAIHTKEQKQGFGLWMVCMVISMVVVHLGWHVIEWIGMSLYGLGMVGISADVLNISDYLRGFTREQLWWQVVIMTAVLITLVDLRSFYRSYKRNQIRKASQA
jgi:hypothetical protein